MNEYRCTRNELYDVGSPGYDNLKARNGHYIDAADEFEALIKMHEKFPEDHKGFTVELWKRNV